MKKLITLFAFVGLTFTTTLVTAGDGKVADAKDRQGACNFAFKTKPEAATCMKHSEKAAVGEGTAAIMICASQFEAPKERMECTRLASLVGIAAVHKCLMQGTTGGARMPCLKAAAGER